MNKMISAAIDSCSDMYCQIITALVEKSLSLDGYELTPKEI